jgi:hypothetical protein
MGIPTGNSASRSRKKTDLPPKLPTIKPASTSRSPAASITSFTCPAKTLTGFGPVGPNGAIELKIEPGRPAFSKDAVGTQQRRLVYADVLNI